MSSADAAVVAWLRSRGFDPEAHGADHDLIENRVIDSLHFMEFVLLLEQFAQRQILVEGMTLDHFRTLRAIRDNFLADAECDDMEEEAI